jgi:hypothetical protein
MAISDLISTSFLFSISIIIILIGGIFAYTSYRFSEQNHKLTSMLGLVTTLAEEIRTIKSLNTHDEEIKEEKNEIHIFDNNMMSAGPDLNLIEVSDDEVEDSEDDSDSDSASEDDSESDSVSEESNSESDDLILEASDLNVLEEMETTINDDIDDINDINDINDNNNNNDNIKSIHLAEPINLEPSESIAFDSLNTNTNVNANDLKTITISDIDMDVDAKPDFKKMSLNKLREVVAERNLVSDASKLKKADLLKLLGEKE